MKEEMERDCIIAHGASEILKERLFKVSDPFTTVVCENCGIMTSATNTCQSCKGDLVKTCNVPYASKLMLQELTAIGLKTLIRPKV